MRRKFLILSCGLLFAAGSMNAQVGIGTSTPDASAVLDITSSNKGVVFPRVTLTSRTDNTTIPSPAKGLMVYNTGTDTNFKIEGYLFWDGAEWRIFNSGQTISPTIDGVSCGNAELKPSTYKAADPYEGILEVTYTNGNGGTYPGSALTAVPGTNFFIQLQSGTLEYGTGVLKYRVTTNGAPAGITAPTTLLNLPVEVPFAGISCTATVGTANANIVTRTFLGPMTASANGGNEVAEFVVTTLDDKYQIRFVARSGGGKTLEDTDIEMRINPAYTGATTDNLILMHTYTWTQIQGGAPNYGTSTGGVWVGNNTSAGQSWNSWAVNNTWQVNGDPQVYALGAPEYHQMIFMSSDPLQKRVYRYTLFFGAPTSNLADYANTKCWVYAEEIQSE